MIEVQAKGYDNFDAFRNVYAAEIVNHSVCVDGLKVHLDSESPKFSFVDSRDFFGFIADDFSDSSVD